MDAPRHPRTGRIRSHSSYGPKDSVHPTMHPAHSAAENRCVPPGISPEGTRGVWLFSRIPSQSGGVPKVFVAPHRLAQSPVITTSDGRVNRAREAATCPLLLAQR